MLLAGETSARGIACGHGSTPLVEMAPPGWKTLEEVCEDFKKRASGVGKTVPVAHIASKLLITSWIPSAFGTLCCSASDLEAACRAAQHHPRRRVPRERFAQARRGEEPALSFESGSRSKLT